MLIFHVQIKLNSDFGYRWKTKLARGGENTPSQKTLNGQSLNVFSLNMILCVRPFLKELLFVCGLVDRQTNLFLSNI
jgi:hypothetical protein